MSFDMDKRTITLKSDFKAKQTFHSTTQDEIKLAALGSF
jgi:hypothetical protein